MEERKVFPTKFWLQTERSLLEVGQALHEGGVIQSFHRDIENVYEWLECSLTIDIELNISRKHSNGKVRPKEPLGFLLISTVDFSVSEEHVSELAESLHRCVGTRVHIGSIDYLGGDDFRYTSTRTLEP